MSRKRKSTDSSSRGQAIGPVAALSCDLAEVCGRSDASGDDIIKALIVVLSMLIAKFATNKPEALRVADMAAQAIKSATTRDADNKESESGCGGLTRTLN